jgi:hypothetical protein
MLRYFKKNGFAQKIFWKTLETVNLNSLLFQREFLAGSQQFPVKS